MCSSVHLLCLQGLSASSVSTPFCVASTKKLGRPCPYRPGAPAEDTLPLHTAPEATELSHCPRGEGHTVCPGYPISPAAASPAPQCSLTLHLHSTLWKIKDIKCVFPTPEFIFQQSYLSVKTTYAIYKKKKKTPKTTKCKKSPSASCPALTLLPEACMCRSINEATPHLWFLLHPFPHGGHSTPPRCLRASQCPAARTSLPAHIPQPPSSSLHRLEAPEQALNLLVWKAPHP